MIAIRSARIFRSCSKARCLISTSAPICGKTCDPAIQNATVDVVLNAEGYTSILNGRFKGGWTTRHYGEPETGVHAIQMELAQSTHLSTGSTALRL